MNLRRHLSITLLLAACVGSTSDAIAEPNDSEASGASGVAESPSTPEDHEISFPISCGADTRTRFEAGVFLLHNMMYEQAHEAFSTAIRSDSECAMLYWGVAMTQFHPQWPGEPTEKALEAGAAAVEAARALTAGATPRERGYIEAVAAYYRDWQQNDRDVRKASWRDAQGRHAAEYPDDLEAQVFFLLARLTTSDPFDSTYAQQLAAAGGLEKLLERQPRHPGLLHYLLHAYDNPLYAPRGVRAAQLYESVAPDAPHALHMPSHIYVRLGQWNQVIAWNIRSQASALRQPAPGGRVSRHYLHALDYLVYGHLQVGDDARAAEEVAKLDPDTPWQLDSGPAAYALAAAPARFALERRAWKEAAALRPRAVPYDWDRYPWAEAITHAARGLGAARLGDTAAARSAIDELVRLGSLTRDSWWQRRIRLERDAIAGWVAHEEGNTAAAIELLGNAAEEELAVGKLSVEPGHTFYAVEHLGELLLEQNRPHEALEAFRRSLADSPRRLHSLYGAGRAAEMAGMQKEASEYFAALTRMVVAESDRPQVQYATDFSTKVER